MGCYRYRRAVADVRGFPRALASGGGDLAGACGGRSKGGEGDEEESEEEWEGTSTPEGSAGEALPGRQGRRGEGRSQRGPAMQPLAAAGPRGDPDASDAADAGGSRGHPCGARPKAPRDQRVVRGQGADQPGGGDPAQPAARGAATAGAWEAAGGAGGGYPFGARPKDPRVARGQQTEQIAGGRRERPAVYPAGTLAVYPAGTPAASEAGGRAASEAAERGAGGGCPFGPRPKVRGNQRVTREHQPEQPAGGVREPAAARLAPMARASEAGAAGAGAEYSFGVVPKARRDQRVARGEQAEELARTAPGPAAASLAARRIRNTLDEIMQLLRKFRSPISLSKKWMP